MASLLSYKHISRQFRLGVRFLSSVSESNNNSGAAQKFAVKIKSSPATNITENEIDEMFEYSADTDDDIADSWDDAMNVVKTSEILFPPHKPSEEELGNIRAAQPSSTLVSLVNTSDTLQRPRSPTTDPPMAPPRPISCQASSRTPLQHLNKST